MAEKRVNLEDLRNMLPPMLTCKDVFILGKFALSELAGKS